MLIGVRLSPKFSPLFFCTTCGKPVLPYRVPRDWQLVLLSGKLFQRAASIATRGGHISLFIRYCQEKNAPGKSWNCRPHRDRRLFGLSKYALIRPSQDSQVKYGTTCRRRNHLDHHHSDSRHRRFCSRSENRGTIAWWLPAQSWGSALRAGAASSNTREVLTRVRQIPGIKTSACPLRPYSTTSIPGYHHSAEFSNTTASSATAGPAARSFPTTTDQYVRSAAAS